MQENGFRKVMLLKTDEELIEIIKNKRADYQEKAILDIEAILTERGIDFNKLPFNDKELDEELISDNKDLLIENGAGSVEEYGSKNTLKPESVGKVGPLTFGPLLVGIVMVLFAFVSIEMEVSSDDAMIINVLSTVGFRIIVLLWTLELVKKYQLNKAVWIILGLLFGGWQLIAINIAIWMVPEDDPTKSNAQEKG